MDPQRHAGEARKDTCCGVWPGGRSVEKHLWLAVSGMPAHSGAAHSPAVVPPAGVLVGACDCRFAAVICAGILC
jgi:hypothetical protein